MCARRCALWLVALPQDVCCLQDPALDPAACDGTSCKGHEYYLWSDQHSDLQNPWDPENAFSSDFVQKYDDNRLFLKTGDRIFNGCATRPLELAAGYGNIRTFDLLCKLV